MFDDNAAYIYTALGGSFLVISVLTMCILWSAYRTKAHLNRVKKRTRDS